jgi:hypothetical protein
MLMLYMVLFLSIYLAGVALFASRLDDLRNALPETEKAILVAAVIASIYWAGLMSYVQCRALATLGMPCPCRQVEPIACKTSGDGLTAALARQIS